MSFDEITAIVRRRYETGDYGNAHLKVAPDVLDLMRRQPAPARRPWEFGDPLGDLMSIPIVLDESLPAGHWRLVDDSTGATIHTSLSRTMLLVADVRAAVHRKAELLRAETWAEQELLRGHGPSDWTRKRWEFVLAWADLLDALVGIDYRQRQPDTGSEDQ